MFNYLIIGSGLSGSVIAERIASKLNKKVLIIEKRNHIGGNCYDYIDKNGIIVHKYGPHLFHTDYKEVWDYVSNFTDWRIYHHKVLAFIDGEKVPIPFNFNTLYTLFPYSFAKNLEKKLIEKFGYGKRLSILKLKEIDNKEIKFLAEYIYEKVFKNYTIKQWGLKPEEIDAKVTARVPIVLSRDNRYFTDKYQGVPKEGYTKIFEHMLNHPNIKILLNTNFKELIHIDISTKKIYFLDQEFKGKLIFTAPIDELFNYKFDKLPYRSIDMKFKTVEKEYYQETAVVNYPNDYEFTRITEFKYIHPVNTKKTTILYEYPKNYDSEIDIPYYPVFTKEAQEVFNRYKELAKGFENIIPLGRLADYRYYDMDDTIKRALEVFEERVR